MSEREEKTIIFPYDAMIITIPPESANVSVEVKETPDDLLNQEEVMVLTSIGFFICRDGRKSYVELSKPATLKVMLHEKYGDTKKLVWWNGDNWEPFDSQRIEGNYCIVKTTGWREDPAIGWG